MLADHPRGEASHAHAPLRNPDPIPRRRGRPPQPPEVLAAAGAMMRERREKLGLSLAFVSRRINVCNVHLSDVERGRKGISADVAEAWAKALALPVAEVCCAFRVVPEQAAERFFDPDRMRAALAGGCVMGSLFLSPPRDWSAVTLREMRHHIAARSVGAPERLPCHWFGADFHDAGENFCRICAEKLVDQKYAVNPKRFVYLYGECDTAEERYRAAIDGGWCTDHDSPPYCETCGASLDGVLTDYGVEEEIEALTTYAIPTTPHDWAMLDLAMINVRGEDMTLAEYVAQPMPKDPLDAKIHATEVGIWKRVAPIVIADMAWKGGA